ncbi:hypothetical protein J2I47_17490 [Fibrella sp. HMF5335]|uniref:AAA domain-containing protein n=1 Tax=Fibrella rubiginis TaxID=2817060 RepID=A0A939K4F0_9BACT|nr:hypothetical protein [Fibrella rubiginis]MBO0938349.1 hypothetical protein [Fibrella rubiginis]
MQIISLHLYSTTGKVRSLNFKLGSLNIITGRSGTGKSAIIDIVDYCLGRSTFNVFEGVNRDVISWYALLLQFKDSQVFVAKQSPSGMALSQSQVYWQESFVISLPAMSDLIANTNDESIKKNLSRLIGISPNQTIVADGRTMDSFQATIDHTKYYLFQDQNLVANKKSLFW